MCEKGIFLFDCWDIYCFFYLVCYIFYYNEVLMVVKEEWEVIIDWGDDV